MKHNRKTSARVAKEAARVLRDKHATRMEKSVAGSALSQRAPRHRSRR